MKYFSVDILKPFIDIFSLKAVLAKGGKGYKLYWQCVKCVQEGDDGINDKANQYFAILKCLEEIFGNLQQIIKG